jgi:hypothetical protein
MNPVIVDNVFTNERLEELKEYFNNLVNHTKIKTNQRTIFDSINNPALQMLGQELLPIAKKVFKKDNIYSIKTTFAHYEGPQGVLKPHIDHQKDVMLVDVCIYEDVPWGIVVEGETYYFPVNSAVAFESGKVKHWRDENPDIKNNKTGVLLAYFNEIKLDIYSEPMESM